MSLIEALNGPITITKQVDNSGSTENTTDSTQTNQVGLLGFGIIFRLSCIFPKKSSDKPDKKDQETMGSREKLNQNAVDFRMSVLLSKEDGSVACVTKELLTKHSPLMQRAPVSRDKNPREKGGLRIQSSQPVAATAPTAKEANASTPLDRESVQLVNERSKLPNLTEMDDDSEAEKLSPLLQKSDPDGAEQTCDTYEKMPNIENVDSRSQKSVAALAAAEDSDYYTPEDPHTTILSPLKDTSEEKSDGAKKLSTPLTVLKEASQSSLPDSPISGNSHTSTRSSGDSYSSSSSTRQLLSSVTANDTPTHVTVNVDASAEGLVKHEIKIDSGKLDCIDSD